MSARTFAIVGAGAVGGRLAGLMAQAGLDVALMARGKPAGAIRANGLIVRGPKSEETVRVDVLDEASATRPVDCVIVAVKAWQVEEAAKRMRSLLHERTLILPMQNGIEASDRLGHILGPRHLIGGVAQLIAWVESPGVIRWIGEAPILTIGHLIPEQAEPVEVLAESLRKAALKVIVSKDIAAALWEKLVFIAPLGGVGAVSRTPIGPVRETPETRSLLQSAIEEITAIARARGVKVPDNTVETAMRKIDSLPADATSSMHRDIVNGRPSELDDLLGAVIRAAEGTKIQPVASRFLLAALIPQERRARGGVQNASP